MYLWLGLDEHDGRPRRSHSRLFGRRLGSSRTSGCAPPLEILLVRVRLLFALFFGSPFGRVRFLDGFLQLMLGGNPLINQLLERFPFELFNFPFFFLELFDLGMFFLPNGFSFCSAGIPGFTPTFQILQLFLGRLSLWLWFGGGGGGWLWVTRAGFDGRGRFFFGRHGKKFCATTESKLYL